MFISNDIISIEEANDVKQLERILWIDEGNVICYTINIENEKALPIKRKISDLQQLHEEELVSFIDSEPYGFIYKEEDQHSEKNKKLRDERWECIENLVSQEPEIYKSEKRGRLIRTAINKTGKSKRLLYKYMIQYWQRGKVKNAVNWLFIPS